MIGRSTWYPLWEESQLEVAHDNIIQLASEDSKVVTDRLFASPNSSPFQSGKSSPKKLRDTVNKVRAVNQIRAGGEGQDSRTIKAIAAHKEIEIKETPSMKHENFSQELEVEYLKRLLRKEEELRQKEEELRRKEEEIHKKVNASWTAVCWAMLTNSKKVIDQELLRHRLEVLGLTEASELPHCSTEVIQELASFLKPVPKAKFLSTIYPILEINSLTKTM